VSPAGKLPPIGVQSLWSERKQDSYRFAKMTRAWGDSHMRTGHIGDTFLEKITFSFPFKSLFLNRLVVSIDQFGQ
jgi:hypothetical protein